MFRALLLPPSPSKTEKAGSVKCIKVVNEKNNSTHHRTLNSPKAKPMFKPPNKPPNNFPLLTLANQTQNRKPTFITPNKHHKESNQPPHTNQTKRPKTPLPPSIPFLRLLDTRHEALQGPRVAQPSQHLRVMVSDLDQRPWEPSRGRAKRRKIFLNGLKPLKYPSETLYVSLSNR